MSNHPVLDNCNCPRCAVHRAARQIKEAVTTGNATLAAEVADRMRGHGSTYQSIVTFAQKACPDIEPKEVAERWEDLMQEAE